MKKIWFVVFVFTCFWSCPFSYASDSVSDYLSGDAGDNTDILKVMTEKLVQINADIGMNELSYDVFENKLSDLLKLMKNKTATSFDFKRYTILIVQNPLNSLKAAPANLLPYYKLLQKKKISELALIFGYDSILLHNYDQSLVYLHYFLKHNQKAGLSLEVRLKTAQIQNRLCKYEQSHLTLDALMDEYVADKTKFPMDFAERIYQIKALNYRQTGNILLAEKTYWAILEIISERSIPHRMAELNNQMALFYLETGQYDKSFDCLNRAFDLLKESMPDSITRFHKDKIAFEKVYIHSITLQYSGLLHLQLNQADDAQTSIQKSIENFALLSSRKDAPYLSLMMSKLKYNECYGYNLLGQLYVRKKDYDAALNATRMAYKIAENTQYQRGKIDALTGFGGIEHARGNFDAAIKHLKEALVLMGKDDAEADFRLKIPVLIGMAQALKKKSDFQAANKFYDQAINISVENKINFFSWELYKGKAEIYIATGDDKKAYENYEQALELIEKTRFLLSDEIIKYSYMEDKFSVYDDFIRFLINLHEIFPGKAYDKKAFEVFEKKQARIFLEKIGRSMSENNTGVPEELIFQQQGLENDIYFLTRKLAGQRVLNSQLKKNEKITELKEKIRSNQNKLDKIRMEIKTINPDFYRLRYPEPIDLDRIQNILLKPDDLIFVYHVATDTAGVWVIGKTYFSYFDLPLAQNSLKKALDKLYIDLEYKQVFDYDASVRRFAANSFEMSHKLIPAPVRKMIPKNGHLFIVPTLELYRLSFETLVMENTEGKIKYLIEDIPIAYLSSSALLNLFSYKDQKTQRLKQSLLAFGNPDYSDGKTNSERPLLASANGVKKNKYLQIIRAGNTTGQFQQLPQTEVEVTEIAKIMGIDKDSGALNFGINASESHVNKLNIAGKLKDYNYLIFACHGILPGEINGMIEPAVILSQPDPLKTFDGFLTMTEVFKLRMNTDLTLLSACSTGGGTLFVGEGIRGMARAFMYAGSNAVAVNLWMVDSKAARLNSVDFFRYIKNGKEKSSALRQAKLNMIYKDHGLKYSHPFFWGSMILFGNGHN